MNWNLDKRAASKLTFALEINQRDQVICPPKLKVPAKRVGRMNSAIVAARVWACVTHRSFISLLSLTVVPRKWPCAIAVTQKQKVKRVGVQSVDLLQSLACPQHFMSGFQYSSDSRVAVSWAGGSSSIRELTVNLRCIFTNT